MARAEIDPGVAVEHRPVAPERVRLLLQLGDALARAGSDPAAVPEALAAAAVQLPADLVAVWTLEAHAGLQVAAVRTRGGDTAAARDRLDARLARDDAALEDALVRVLRTGRATRWTRLGGADSNPTWPGPANRGHGRRLRMLSPGLRRLVAEHDVGSIVLAPLTGRSGRVGVLGVARTTGRPDLTRDDRELLEVLGDRTALALEATRLIARVSDQAAVVDTVSDAVIAVNGAGRVTTWNSAAERVYGLGAAQVLGRRLSQVIVGSAYEDGQDSDGVALQLRRHGHWRGRVRQTSAAGRTVEVESQVTARGEGRGRDRGLVAVNRDLTEVVAARAAVQAQERVSRELLDALDSRAAVLDRGARVVACNARWVGGIVERDRCAAGPVRDGQDWVAALRRSGLADVAAFALEVEAVLRGERPVARMECRCLAAGPERAVAVEVAALHGPAGGAVVVQSDVSWRRRLQDELAHRATHDELTGLPNRAALVERLLASLRRMDGSYLLAVLFCDLDGFKDINDGLGHAVGDQVLLAVARRLRQRCRQADVVARFGGDEFVVVLPVPDIAQARAAAERLVQALSEPIAVGDAEVAPGASIGITVVDAAPDVPDPVGALLREADTAMYHAKERGRGRYEFYDAGLREHVTSRLEYASALRRAIGNGELRLCYQTRRRCGDRAVAGVEALLRWRHPTLGEVSPADFIPVAERTGRIVEVGGWAMRRALSETGALHDRRLTVAVNVSPRQLQSPQLVAMVDEALAGSGLEPARLTLEITEGALLEDPVTARAVLTDLRRLGVSVALDDFGTGWSSMAYLRTLPVDVLKIDRSFVADLPHDPQACAVVAAVLGLGHGMGLTVVAEGVEDEDQLSVLRDMGCDEYQGFIDGRPGVLADVLAVRV